MVTHVHCEPKLRYSTSSFSHLIVGKYYNLSVGHNIGIGDTSSMDDKEAISRAAETGGALDFISSFPDAFETIMAHHHYQRAGHKKKKVQLGISGGQWQRLALSRAFMRLKSADLLLLDEPSASLDPEAEFKLFKALKEARRGRTTIYISHRFNTVRAANRIMVSQVMAIWLMDRSLRRGSWWSLGRMRS